MNCVLSKAATPCCIVNGRIQAISTTLSIILSSTKYLTAKCILSEDKKKLKTQVACGVTIDHQVSNASPFEATTYLTYSRGTTVLGF